MKGKRKARLPGDMHQTLIGPYLVGSMLGLVLLFIPSADPSQDLTIGLAITAIAAWILVSYYARRAIVARSTRPVAYLSQHAAQALNLAKARVIVDPSLRPQTDWKDNIWLTEHPSPNNGMWAALAHELCHLGGGHVKKRVVFSVISSLMLGMLSMQTLSMLEVINFQAVVLIWLAGGIAALINWTAGCWVLELMADVNAVRLSHKVTWVTHDDLLKRRIEVKVGFHFTHPPRFLRVWATKLPK